MESDAKVSVFDRGFLFSDGVYEVTAVLGGKLVGWEGHIARLKRSLTEIGMLLPESEPKLLELHREIIEKNNLSEGIVYLQVTRGQKDRDFLITDDTRQSVVVFSQEVDLLDPARLDRGLKITIDQDTRWGRSDIKTTQLLASSLIKTGAVNRGFDDAWLERDGYITEGTSSNAFIVDQQNHIITRNLSCEILSGVTRSAIIQSTGVLGLKIEQRPFSIEEAKSAREAFITSASNFVVSVIEIDGFTIGNGKIGPVTRSLREEYLAHIIKTCV